MTYKEALEELKKYKSVLKSIEILQIRISALEKYGYLLNNDSSVRVETGRGKSTVELSVLKLQDLKEELECQKLYSDCLASDTTLKINKLDSPYKEILSYSYIEDLSEIKILRKINYERSSYYKKKSQSIKMYAEL